MGEAYPATAPAAAISSSWAGLRDRAPAALASLISLTSRSPRITARTRRSPDSPPASAALKRPIRKTAFAVRLSGTSRKAASSAIVAAPGVATFSRGAGSSAAASALAKRATSVLAAYPQASHRARVFSPTSLRYMNSWAAEPPIMPTSERTARTGRPQRRKMLK